jgi:copper chaperone CopZ
MVRILVAVVLASLVAGCAEQVSDVPAAAEVTVTSFNASGAPTVEFNVPDMMCPEGCGEKVKETLAEQAGAKEVLIDFESKTATVAVEEGKFNADSALAALVDHGFDHSTLSSEAAKAPATEAAVQ